MLNILNFLVFCAEISESAFKSLSSAKMNEYPCFTESYGSYLRKMQEAISYYDKLCGITNHPELEQTFKYYLFLEDFNSRMSLNATLVNQELLQLLQNSTKNFPTEHQHYMSNQTSELVKLYTNSLPRWKNLTYKEAYSDTSDLVKGIKSYLKLNIIYKNEFPEFMKNNMRRLIQYRRMIIHILNMLTNNYAKYTDCLPSDFDYLPVFKVNITDWVPEANRIKCKRVKSDQVIFDASTIDQGGIALTFWLYENLDAVRKSNLNHLDILNTIINNRISSSYFLSQNLTTATVDSYKFTIKHVFKFNSTEIAHQVEVKCAQYVFVLLAIEKDCDRYKLITSMRFAGNNIRVSFNTSLSAEEVEDVVILFNRVFNTVSRINFYHNFVWSESEELKLIFEGYDEDSSIKNKMHALPKDYLTTCDNNPTCAYSFIKGQCSICEKGYVNFNGLCIDSCPDGYYKYKNFECKPCESNCDKCSGERKCEKCKPGYLLYEDKCVFECPEHAIEKTFFSNITNTNITICEECDVNCLQCSKYDKGCFNCKGHYVTYDGKCVLNCPEGYYKDSLRKACIRCDSKCLLCHSSNEEEKCDRCRDNYYLFNDKCFDSCGKGYYMNNVTRTCDKCIDNCLNCFENPSNCTICREGYQLTLNPLNGKYHCNNKCPPSHMMIDGVCLPCSLNNCLECSLTDMSLCKRCDNSTVLKDGRCEKVCGNGFYLNHKLNQCEKCESHCEKCTESSKCLNCLAPKLLLNDETCVDQCPQGFIKVGNVCVKCQNLDCLKCSAVNTEVCSQCYPGQVLHEGMCINSCPQSFFKVNGICEKCITGCEICKDMSTCRRCASGWVLKNDVCVKECGDGYSLDESGKICVKCFDPSCNSCYTHNPSQCKKCKYPSFLYLLQCVEECPVGTYPNENYECRNCPSNCAYCDNKYSCKRCVNGKFLYNGICVDICDSGFANILGECKKCTDVNCSHCDSSIDSCTKCRYPYISFEKRCVLTCPDGFYFDYYYEECRRCDMSCSKCSSKLSCTECPSGFSLKNGVCVDECPFNTVRDLNDKTKCHPCPGYCNKCNPANLNECYVCQDGFKFNVETKTCVNKCPKGFYLDGDKCITCLDGCLNCDKSKCYECETGQFLCNGKCVDKCPIGYTEIIRPGQPAFCKACEATNCNKCDRSLKICYECQKPWVLYADECYEYCPSSYYLDVKRNRCEICKVENCQKCDQEGEKCRKCAEGYFYIDGKCEWFCPAGYKENSNLNYCEKCEIERCAYCNNSKNSCDTCEKGYFYDKKEKKCLKDCPVGTFQNYDKKTCEDCSYNCLICSNPHTCQKCDSYSVLFEGRCIPHCPSKYYQNTETQTCNKCDDTNCLKCPSKEKCSVCVHPYFLSGDKCLPKCPEKTYPDIDGVCRPCNSGCLKCSSYEHCDQCEDGKVILNNGKCSDKCPDNTVLLNSTCVPCQSSDPFCKKCDNQNLSQCSKCIYPKVLFPVDNSCIESCPDNYYESDHKCKICDYGCKICKSDKECIECRDKLFLFNGRCINDCPSGYFKKNKECIPCSVNCQECQEEKNCKVCNKDLVISNGDCKSECDSGTYFNPTYNKCLPCKDNCAFCSNSDNCNKCQNNKVMLNGECVDVCADGYVNTSGNCEKCNKNCKVCEKNKECKICESPYVLLNGNCVSECPSAAGYYTNYNKTACEKCKTDCARCSLVEGSYNITKCEACKYPLKLLNNTCIYDCAQNYTLVDNICMHCTTRNCKDCKGNFTECNECHFPYFLYSNKCVQKCPDGTYADINRKCQDCDVNCKFCNDKETCNQCLPGYNLTFIPNMKLYQCLSPCGYSQTLINGKCQPCDVKDCETCSSPESCQKCTTQTYLLINQNLTQCLPKCPEGYFINTDKNYCERCSSDCSICEDSKTCKECKKGYAMLNGQCVSRCPSNYTERQSKCFPCESNCLECDNIFLTNCRECDRNFYLLDGKCVEKCDTINGYYISYTNKGKVCEKCGAECRKCDNQQTCIECNKPFKLKNGECINECPESYVEDSNGDCRKCIDDNCLKCNGNSLSNCNKCKFPYVNFNGKCYSKCPEGYNLNFEDVCVKCADDNCRLCGPTSICKECKDGFFLHLGKCMNPCPEGTTRSNGKCEYCLPDYCSKCSSQDSSRCEQCMSGYFLAWLNNSWVCLPSCPEGSFVNNGKCEKCSDHLCSKCYTAEQCTKCKQPYQLKFDEIEKKVKCIDTCPDGFSLKSITVNNTLTTECFKCNITNNEGCSKCDTQTGTECRECKQGQLLYKGNCYNKCPDGTYKVNNNECDSCDRKCSQCSVSNFNCTECRSPFVYDDRTKTCLDKCNDGYVEVKGQCQKCQTDDPNCKLCDSLSLKQCKQCFGNLILYNNTCIDLCPSGTYYDNINNVCQKCNENCRSCQIQSNGRKSYNSSCTECQTGLYLWNGQCLKDCPDNYFKNYTECNKCVDSNCRKCDFNGHCLDCYPPYVIMNGRCESKCQTGNFIINGTCHPCSNDCLECVSYSNCIRCLPPYKISPDGKCGMLTCPNGYVDRDGVCLACTDPNCRICDTSKLGQCKDCQTGFVLFEGRCLEKCPNGFFLPPGDPECKPCSKNCALCSDEKNCTICQRGFYKLNGDCVECTNQKFVVVGSECLPCKVKDCDKCLNGFQDKCEVCSAEYSLTSELKCTDYCPQGTYRNETTHKCQNCLPDCKSCKTSQKCESCKLPYVFLEGQCVMNCPTGYTQYLDPITNESRCRKCRDKDCLICDGPKPEICLKCEESKMLFNGECINKCPYAHFSFNNTCLPCPQNCVSCEFKGYKTLNTTEHNIKCLKCDVNFKLQHEKCEPECSHGYFEDEDRNCKKCVDSNCIYCNPIDICRKCDNSTFLDKSKEKCVEICPDGFFKNPETRECKECGKGCKNCKDNNSCYVCENGYTLNNNTCTKECPDQYTKVNNICQKCSQTECLKCKDNKPDQCIKCMNDTYLENGVCQKKCEKGTYADPYKNKCVKCDPKCKSCFNMTHCTDCKTGFSLHEGKCVNSCPDGKVDHDGKCECCQDHNCKTCTLDLINCIECQPDYFLYENTCVKVCPAGYYKNKLNKCKKCDEGCALCFSHGSCSKCHPNFYLSNGLCLRDCPDGFYGDCVSGDCLKCHSNCETCIDGSNINCPLCYKGFYKSGFACVEKDNCQFGTYADEEKRKCVSCKIPHCDECRDRNSCKKCINGYILDKHNTTCSEYKTFVNVVKSPFIFSRTSYSKFNTYSNGYSFNSTLKSACVDSKIFTVTFWMRLITNSVKNSPSLIQVSDLNGIKMNFVVQYETCSLLIMKDTDKVNSNGTSKSFELNIDDCSFLKLNNWNFFVININKEREITSNDVNFISYNLDSNKTLRISRNFTEEMFSKNSFIITKTSKLIINSEYFKAPIYEIANMNIMEFLPQTNDFNTIVKDLPNDCDYNCEDCVNSKCVKCKDGREVDENGICPAAFISITNGLSFLGKSTNATNDLASYLTSNYYLSSAYYTLTGMFYISPTTGEVNQKLFSIYYPEENNIINVTIVQSSLSVKVSDIEVIDSKYMNNTKIVSSGKWYGIHISVTKSMIKVHFFNAKQELIQGYDRVLEMNEFTLRLSSDAMILLGDNSNENSIYYYNTRLYINNIVSINNKDEIGTLPCDVNCEECDGNLRCLKCNQNYELNSKLNTCEMKSIGVPTNIYARKSFYNNAFDILYSPYDFMQGDFTFSLWFRKNLPSAVPKDQDVYLPGYTQNLISFFDKESRKMIPIIKQRILSNLTSVFIIDNSELLKLSLSPGSITHINNRASSDGSLNGKENERDYFNHYMNRLEDKVVSIMANKSFYKELYVDYKNNTPKWNHIGLSSRLEGATRFLNISFYSYNIKNGTTFGFEFPESKRINNSLILGDPMGIQINMETGPNSLFINRTVYDSQLKLLYSLKPKDCDPSCLDCNYNSGYCRLCGIDKLQGYDCNLFFYGLKKTAIYDSSQYQEVKKVKNEALDDYNIEIRSLFNKDVNSGLYSVMGWFQLFDLMTKSGESIVYRLSNYDDSRIREDDINFNYYPGINLITLKIIYSENNAPKYAFVLSDYDQDRIITVDNLTVRKDEWLMIYSWMMTKKRLFGYSIYSELDNKTYSANFTLNYFPQRLQRISTLKLFGVDSILAKNTLETHGFFYNIYLTTNRAYNPDATNKFRNFADPTILNKNITSCDSTCTKCLVETCFSCESGYVLSNNACVPEKVNANYILLTDQNYLTNLNTKIFFPASVITDRYGFQFNIRRNYIVNSDDMIPRVFLELGSLKLSIVTNAAEASIKFESSTDPSSAVLLGPLDSNPAFDYEWYTVNMNFIAAKETVELILLNSLGKKVGKTEMKYKLVRSQFDNVLINNLNYEVTVYGALFILNGGLSTPLLATPEIDCPVDCAYCEKNNLCKLCTFGNECDINDPSYNYCKISYRRMDSLEVSQLVNSNVLFLNSIFPTNKLVRFQQYALLFSVEMTEGMNFNNILRITNNVDYSLNNESNLAYNLLNLSYNQEKQSFIFSYHNRYTLLKFQSAVSTEISTYPSTKNLKEKHYIGLTYNSESKKITILLFNSPNNFVLETINVLGENENFGLYTNLVFLDDFVKLNPGKKSRVTNLRFLYEYSQSGNDMKSKILQMYLTDNVPQCDNMEYDLRICKKCSESNILLNGLCLPKTIPKTADPFIYYSNKPITSFFIGDSQPLIMTGYQAETNSFTLNFLYKKISYDESDLSSILSVSIFNADKSVHSNILELYEVKDKLIAILKGFESGKEIVGMVDNYYDNWARFPWMHFSFRADYINKSLKIYIYNYLNKKVTSKTFILEKSDTSILPLLSAGQSFGINYDLTSVKLTIDPKIVINPPIYELSPGRDTEFKISDLIFIPNYLYTDSELEKFKPNQPSNCICGCACVNEICPNNCKLENIFVDLSYSNKDLVFNKISDNIKNSLTSNYYNNDIANINTNSEDYIQSLNASMNYNRFSVSFSLNVKNYLGATSSNKALYRQNAITFATTSSTSSMDLISSQALTSPAITFVTTDSKETTKNSNPNNNLLFLLTNQYDQIENIKTGSGIPERVIKFPILSVDVLEGKIRVYIGSDIFTDYVSYFELEIDLTRVDKLVFLVYADLNENFIKTIIFADNRRYDKMFNYNFAVERINRKTLFYTHPMLINPKINFGMKLENHILQLKSMIDTENIKQGLCPSSCKTCHGNRCLECGFKKRLHNNSCIDVSSNKDYNFETRKTFRGRNKRKTVKDKKKLFK